MQAAGRRSSADQTNNPTPAQQQAGSLATPQNVVGDMGRRTPPAVRAQDMTAADVEKLQSDYQEISKLVDEFKIDQSCTDLVPKGKNTAKSSDTILKKKNKSKHYRTH